MKKTHKTIVFTIVSMSILTVCIVLGFYSIIMRKQSRTEEEPKTEVELLIKKDIKENYPGTPREVLKLYARITKCIYNEETSEEEFKQLASQLRLLFDEELLENNKEEVFLENLNADILGYHERKEIISSYDIELSDEIEYAMIKDKNYAALKVSFFIQEGGKKKTFTKAYEQFLLRQDEKKQWKIVHWKLADKENQD